MRFIGNCLCVALLMSVRRGYGLCMKRNRCGRWHFIGTMHMVFAGSSTNAERAAGLTCRMLCISERYDMYLDVIVDV